MPVGDSLVNWQEDTAHHGQHHFLGMDGVLKCLNRKPKLSTHKQERLHPSIVLCSWLWTWSALTSPTVMDYHQELQDEINHFSQFLFLRVISTATKAKLTDKFSSGGGGLTEGTHHWGWILGSVLCKTPSCHVLYCLSSTAPVIFSHNAVPHNRPRNMDPSNHGPSSHGSLRNRDKSKSALLSGVSVRHFVIVTGKVTQGVRVPSAC